MSSNIIAVLDDEPDIVELVSLHLKKANFEVKEYLAANDLYKDLEKYTPDLLVLDLMLPGADGIEICKDLRRNPKLESMAIIILTAKNEEVDKIVGLELGADDYVTKPFSPKELTARVKAVLRRKETPSQEKPVKRTIDNIEMDLQRYEVRVDGKKIDLTSTEFKILSLLSEKRGWVFSRQQLLSHLWGNEKIVIDRTIDVHIRHLREKLGDAGNVIKNLRGVGYKIE